jgi:hypothetical protein
MPYRKGAPFNITRLAGLTTTIIGMVGSGMADLDMVAINRGDSEVWRRLPDALVAESRTAFNRLRLMLGKNHIVGALIMGEQALSVPLQQMVLKEADISSIRPALLQPGVHLGRVLVDFWQKWKNGE